MKCFDNPDFNDLTFKVVELTFDEVDFSCFRCCGIRSCDPHSNYCIDESGLLLDFIETHFLLLFNGYRKSLNRKKSIENVDKNTKTIKRNSFKLFFQFSFLFHTQQDSINDNLSNCFNNCCLQKNKKVTYKAKKMLDR